MTYLAEHIDDYQSRLSEEDKTLLLAHCNEWDIAPVICAWYDDMDDFLSDWVEEVGYTEEAAKNLLNPNNTQGEFKVFPDGRMLRLVK